VLGIVSGVVGGLVAITPAAGFVAPGGALIIGLAAGAICFWIVGAVLTGVFAVEAIGGTAGALEGNWGQIAIQFEGIVATIVWSAVATAVILLILKALMGLRVDTEAEVEGLDLAIHGETVQ
jgi:Amt family ammonium transporter